MTALQKWVAILTLAVVGVGGLGAHPAWSQKQRRRVIMVEPAPEMSLQNPDPELVVALQQPAGDCWERARTRSPGASGRLWLRVVIGPGGEVQRASATGGDGLPDPLARCMVTRQLAQQHPAPEGGANGYLQPVVFLPSSLAEPAARAPEQPASTESPNRLGSPLTSDGSDPRYFDLPTRPVVVSASGVSAEEALVLALSGRVADCAAEQTGTVAIRALVRPDGRADDPAVTTEPRNQSLWRCVSDSLLELALPAHSGGLAWRVDLRFEVRNGKAWIVR